MKKKIKFHFSVDDVFESLIEISDSNKRLRDHWFFSYLYEIYKKYNIKIAVYLFYEQKINNRLRNLTQVKNIKKHLSENWLYFGAHALNYNNPPHKLSLQLQKRHMNQIYKEIIRFAGKKYLARKVRLHEYSECYELKNELKKYKVESLFATDRKTATYRMLNQNRRELLDRGHTTFKGMNFIRTDFRVENMITKSKDINIKKIKNVMKNKNFLTIYTHEYELKKKICRNNFLNTLNNLIKIYNFESILP